MLSVAWLQSWGRRSVRLPEFGYKVFSRIVTGCSLGFALMLAGCGETPRPVVTPVAVTGPAPQPQSYAVVTTTAGPNLPGLANVFDAPEILC